MFRGICTFYYLQLTAYWAFYIPPAAGDRISGSLRIRPGTEDQGPGMQGINPVFRLRSSVRSKATVLSFQDALQSFYVSLKKMNKEEIKNLIKKAFQDVSLEDGIGLWEAQAIDDYEDKDTQQKQREKDEKNDWSKISTEDLNRCESSLSFFDANGMRFHIPAFILAELDGESNCGPLFHLTDSFWRFSTLNKNQKTAIKFFLEWCLNQKDYNFEKKQIEKSLNDFWRHENL